MINLKAVLEEASRLGASDIHLKVGNYPHIRIEGDLLALQNFDRLQSEDSGTLINDLLNEEQQGRLAGGAEVDFSFGVKGLGRYRASIFHQRGSVAIALRFIPTSVPSITELNLPPVLAEISEKLRGLVLVTGITGSGKSTTIASMVRYLNESRNCHIVTIEDPIEFLFRDELAIISQREVGIDTQNFAAALRAAMRQDPDVIMVGEMRDVETVRIALQAAQTGHLVLSTLHTTDAMTTVDRVISLFPVSQQLDVRLQLAAALNSVISIRLIRSSINGRRVPAVEVLRSTDFVYSLIAQPEKTRELRGAMESGHSTYSMQTFDQSILSLFNSQMISDADALKNASAPADMKLKIKGIIGPSEAL